MTIMTRVDAALAATKPALGGLADGANVRTPCGERRVEFLRPGDLIVTRSDGLQPLRHVIRRHVSLAEMQAEPSLAPIRLIPRALGPMMPVRTLALAPGQPVRVPSYLLAEEARDPNLRLAATTLSEYFSQVFVDMGADGVTYHSLVFDTPQTLMVNGVMVESQTPDAATMDPLDADHRIDLERSFPELRKEPLALAL